MPAAEHTTVKVNIMGREYQIRCSAKRVGALRAAARHLDQRMRELQKNANILSLDGLAVTAALNITNDYFDLLDGQSAQVSMLTEKVGTALGETGPTPP